MIFHDTMMPLTLKQFSSNQSVLLYCHLFPKIVYSCLALQLLFHRFLWKRAKRCSWKM